MRTAQKRAAQIKTSSMEEYRREQLDILADGVRNSLDMDAVYRAMGMENPRRCKA